MTSAQVEPSLVAPSPTSEVARPAGPDRLIDRLRAGDPDACREMIELHAARMLRILMRLRGDRFEAEDLLQETWIRACQAAREFRGDASLRTWLDRIALNAAAMAERRRLTLSRGAGAVEVRLGVPRTGAGGPDDDPGEPGSTADAESTVIWRETLAELSGAVAALPAGLRVVLILRDIQGASTREAADELGVSEDVVKQRLHRARAHLRRALGHLVIDGWPSVRRG